MVVHTHSGHQQSFPVRPSHRYSSYTPAAGGNRGNRFSATYRGPRPSRVYACNRAEYYSAVRRVYIYRLVDVHAVRPTAAPMCVRTLYKREYVARICSKIATGSAEGGRKNATSFAGGQGRTRRAPRGGGAGRTRNDRKPVRPLTVRPINDFRCNDVISDIGRGRYGAGRGRDRRPPNVVSALSSPPPRHNPLRLKTTRSRGHTFARL